MIKIKLTREEILLVIIEAAVKKFEALYRQLQQQLYRYSVTGLYNRKYLLEQGDRLLKEGRRNALAVIDIRNLKTYNEIFGYETTDKILRAIAKKIKSYCGKYCILGNLDSGRFWVLTRLEPAEAEKVLRDFIKFLTEEELTIKLDNEEFIILVSLNVGMAFYPEHGKDIAELLMAAEMATDRAKSMGTDTYLIFKSEYRKEIEENIQIESLLRRSIKSGEIEQQVYPVFQLKVNPQTEEVTGAEVLMRWKLHPKIYKVILVAENTGLIKELFNILVEKTVPVMKEVFQIYPNFSFSFNISPAQLMSVEDLKRTMDNLLSTGLSPERMQLEITETQILENKKVEETLRRFIDSGFKLVIDDFGKGYSSFDRLKEWEIYGVKIDRSLVTDIIAHVRREGKGCREFKFLKNLVNFLKRVGYNVTVEGVEDQATVELLKELDVDEIQGYYYSRPVEKETFLECLRRWKEVKRCPFKGN
jgi:diguanylate cyclase (GGDEF)-like protein